MRKFFSNLKCALRIHCELNLEYESVTHDLYLCTYCNKLVISKLHKKERDNRLIEYMNRLKDIEGGIFK